MRLSIVIPTWNNSDYTIRCLNALKANSEAALHIVWIDNGSTKEEHLKVYKHLEEFDFDMEYHPKPLGFSRAMNRGLLYLKEKYTVFLNNDVEVQQGWDHELIAAISYRPGIAGPLAIDSVGWQDTRKHPWLKIPPHLSSHTEKANWLNKNWAYNGLDVLMLSQKNNKQFRSMLAFFCVAINTKVVRDIGEFDENFGWGYCEDDDYCIRAIKKGYKLTLCPGASVTHANGQTIQNVRGDRMARLKENQRYLNKKWGAQGSSD